MESISSLSLQNGGPLGVQARTAGVAATSATGGLSAPDGFSNPIGVKQSLDARERAWQGIVGGEIEKDDASHRTADAEHATANTSDKSAEKAQGTDVASKTGTNVTDAELQRLFGQDAPAVRQMLNARSDLRVGDLLPLRKDRDGLHSLSDLLTHRSDVKLGDVLSRSADGKVHLDPTVRDGASREFLYTRTDVKPGELTGLRRSLARQFDNPAMARQAYTKSLELLKTRTDLRPDDVGGLITRLGTAVKGTKAGGGPEGAAAMFDMFDKSTKLLTTRTDLNTDDVGRLVDATAKGFGGKDGGNGLSNMRDAFSSATELMQNREGMSVRNVTDVMDTVDQHFGGDGDNKASAFQKAATLMSRVHQVDGQGVATMLKKSAEGPPAQAGDKLLQAFDNTASDVATGKTSLATATTLDSQQTDRQKAEQKNANEQTRINMGRLRTPEEQEKRDREDPLGLTPPDKAPAAQEGRGAEPAKAANDDHAPAGSEEHNAEPGAQAASGAPPRIDVVA